MDLLTRTEELVMLAALALGEEAYGAAIRTWLSDHTGIDWPIASVYTPLDRLARKGLVAWKVGAPTPERGGRSKKVYKVTAKGQATLEEVRAVHAKVLAGLAKG